MKGAQCQRMVSGEGQWGAFHQHQCSKKATVRHNGKWYCTQHDPERVSRLDDERKKQREAKECPKCHSAPKSWWTYCPLCGTRYPNK